MAAVTSGRMTRLTVWPPPPLICRATGGNAWPDPRILPAGQIRADQRPARATATTPDRQRVRHWRCGRCVGTQKPSCCGSLSGQHRSAVDRKPFTGAAAPLGLTVCECCEFAALNSSWPRFCPQMRGQTTHMLSDLKNCTVKENFSLTGDSRRVYTLRIHTRNRCAARPAYNF